MKLIHVGQLNDDSMMEFVFKNKESIYRQILWFSPSLLNSVDPGQWNNGQMCTYDTYRDVLTRSDLSPNRHDKRHFFFQICYVSDAYLRGLRYIGRYRDTDSDNA